MIKTYFTYLNYLVYTTLSNDKEMQKKMGDFIEPGTYRNTNIKVKLKLYFIQHFSNDKEKF